MLFGPLSPLFDADPGAAGAGGADFDAMFSAVVDAPATPAADPAPASSVAAPAAPSATPAAAADSAPAATPGLDPSPETPAVAAPVIEDPEAEDAALDAAQEDPAAPNLLDLKASRGKRIYGGYKGYKAITEALGHEPTPDQAREYFESHTSNLAMEQEFLSGDPAAVANFSAYWHEKSPQAFQQMVSQLPDQLANGDAAGYQALAVPVLQRYINAMYNAARTETDGDKQKALLYAARMNDWNVFGKFRKDAELAGSPAPDPAFAAQQQYVQQGLQQISAFQQQQQAAAYTNWSNGLSQSINSELGTVIDSALSPLKASLPARLYDAARKDFTEAVKQHLSKDVDGQRVFDLNAARAQQRLSSEDHASLTGVFMQRASRAIRTLAPGFLKEAGAAAQSQSTQRHQALAASAAAGTVPSASGAAAPAATSAVAGRKFGSNGEKMDAMLDELLGTGR